MTTVDPEQCIQQNEWGAYGDLGPIFDPDSGGSENLGFVQAGSAGSIFPANPDDGSLIIATTSRYSSLGTILPTGTMSGFGATWDRIYYQEATGSSGAGFSEVWRAQQATYTTPDRLRYDFPPIAAGTSLSSIGFMALSGTDPAGLMDNGASGIRNVTSHGPTLSQSPVVITQPTPYLSEESLMWKGFWRMSDNGSAGTSDLTSDPLSFDAGYQSGRGGIFFGVFSQQVFAELVMWSEGPDQTYLWPAGLARTWWAASLELLADPECVGGPYWGMDARPL